MYANGVLNTNIKPVVCINGVKYNTNESPDITTTSQGTTVPAFATTFPSPNGKKRYENYEKDFIVSIKGTGFIGRDITGTSLALVASVQNFNLWFGELESPDVFSNFLVGDEPSTVYLTKYATEANVNVTFLSISRQNTKIKFYGGRPMPGDRITATKYGEDLTYNIFGDETLFKVTPVDSQCEFSAILRPNSPKNLPAMNYTLTLDYCPLPAPKFDNTTTCKYQGYPCFCSEQPLAPQEYLEKAKLNEQSMTVTHVKSDAMLFNFEYHTGFCFQVIPDALSVFSQVEGDYPSDMKEIGDKLQNYQKVACFDEKAYWMEKGKSNKSVTIFAYERYPRDNKWSTGSKSKILKQEEVYFNENVGVGDIDIRFMDMVTGTSEVSLKYDSSRVYKSDLDTFGKLKDLKGKPKGVQYTIIPNSMNTIFPFDLEFGVYLSRVSATGGFENVDATWYIPVIGVMPNKVPNFYPVSSDPTLIFLVLRDPPGGGSSVTIEQGSTAGFEMAIDGMYAFDAEDSFHVSVNAGADLEWDVGVGLGVFKSDKVFGFLLDVGIDKGISHSVHVEKSSHTSYAYSFSFSSAISTSVDPTVAGHASDLIVGGGASLVTMQALQGFLLYQILVCFHVLMIS